MENSALEVEASEERSEIREWEEKLNAIHLMLKPDYDFYGLYVPSLSKIFGSRFDVVTSQEALASVYREKLTNVLFQNNLYVESAVAGEVFAPDAALPVKDFLQQKGVLFYGSFAYDLFVGLEIMREDNLDFDFFFALKLSSLDLMNVDSFLSYHLKHNFGTHKNEFDRFLTMVIRKFEAPLEEADGAVLLTNSIATTVKEWIGQVNTSIPAQESDKNSQARNHPVLSTNQWVILVHYTFAALGSASRVVLDVSDTARFVHAILGQKFTTIQNSEIYKKCLNINMDRAGLLADLKRVKEILEGVEDVKIIAHIDKKIKELENK